MSERKAKLARKEKSAEELLKKDGGKVLFQVVTTVQRNGRVSVAGFPASITDAIMLVGDINKAMMLHFVKQAMDGNMDSRGVIKEGNIDIPKGVSNHRMAKMLMPEAKPGKIIEVSKDDLEGLTEEELTEKYKGQKGPDVHPNGIRK